MPATYLDNQVILPTQDEDDLPTFDQVVGGPIGFFGSEPTDPYDDIDLSRYDFLDFGIPEFLDTPAFDMRDPKVDSMWDNMFSEGLLGEEGRADVMSRMRQAGNFRANNLRRALQSRIARRGRGAFGGGQLKALTGDVMSNMLGREAEYAGNLTMQDRTRGRELAARQRAADFRMRFGAGFQHDESMLGRRAAYANAERGRRLTYLMFREGVIDKEQFAAMMQRYQIELMQLEAELANSGGGFFDMLGDLAGLVPGIGDAIEVGIDLFTGEEKNDDDTTIDTRVS